MCFYIILYAGYTKLYEYRGPIETSATIRVDVDTNNISLYYDTAAIDPLSLTSSQLVFQGTHSLTETNRILGIGNWSEGASFKYTRFDNIKLTEVPEPITFGMFGLGTIVVLIKRQRKF